MKFNISGISILYSKPKKEPPGLLNFLKPLDTTVWLYMSTALLCVSIVEYFLAKYALEHKRKDFFSQFQLKFISFHRITEADWENPHPCDESPEEFENIWNIHNCIWLALGSIMQQGCDILPK